MKRFLLVAVLVLLSPAALMAQSNEIGIFATSASYSSTNLSDPELQLDVEIDFERGTGFGASYNRFWTPSISTEFAYTVIPSDAKVRLSDGEIDITAGVGEAEFRVLSGIVQWHFAGMGRTTPYIGVGVARVEGEIEVDDEVDGPTTEEFENETTWIANAGIRFALSPRISLGLDAKYVPYKIEESDPEIEDGDIDINPLMISAGLHFRF